MTTTEVTISDITEKVSASGKIQPELEVNISAEVSGQLIQLPVKEGDFVEAGDLLAEINPDLYIASKNRAQAAVNTARSNLASSKASKATSEANLFVAEQAWNRNQSLFSQGVISKADYDQSEASYLTAKANLTSASEGVKSASFRHPQRRSITPRSRRQSQSHTTNRTPSRHSNGFDKRDWRKRSRQWLYCWRNHHEDLKPRYYGG